MDNDAFRALVKERTREKTTKEIARQAVEDEFSKRQKSQRRGRKRRSAASDDDDDDEQDTRQRQDDVSIITTTMIPSSAHRKRKQQQKETSKYRDRAKERRDGTNGDYAGTQSLLEEVATNHHQQQQQQREGAMDFTALSKYLGGDEEHTHLVKGLDIALAHKLKARDGRADAIPNEEELNLDRVLHDAKRHRRQNDGDAGPVRLAQNRLEALEVLKQADPDGADGSTSLGRNGMLSYLRSVHLPAAPRSSIVMSQSSAGYAIQRSTLTFSAIGCPGDKMRSWEIPHESTHAGGDGHSRTQLALTPLDSELLSRIQQAFATRANMEKAIAEAKTAAYSDCPNGSSINSGGHEREDSDDDIFANEGSYVPTALKPLTKSDSTLSKGSFFTGLSVPQPGRLAPATDLSVSRLFRSHRGDPKSGVKGLSVAGYEGGYGEEMDVDFDGRLAVEEEESAKGKKKRKAEATVASTEYGSRWAKN